MMKQVSPSVDMPLVTSPLIHNAMPSRIGPPKPLMKNMTGIFLGTDEHRNYPATKKIVPPLARVRVPTKRSRTPTEERRYKMVELLRYKDERRGFSGNPVKRRTPSATSVLDAPPQNTAPSLVEDEDVAIWDLCRQTQRHFTAATNSGVTHLEYLNPDADGGMTSHDRDAFTVPLSSTLASEVHRLASHRQPDTAQGLIDCYKKVCKGNKEVLQHLLPSRSMKEGQTKSGQNYNYTGFTVKSYRNPNQADIQANFSPPLPSEPASRPRTTAHHDPSRPYIPSPYFFKSYSPPQKPTSANQKGAIHTSPRPAYDEPRIGVAPGAGVLSRSLGRSRQDNSPHNNTPLNMEVLHGNGYTTHKVIVVASGSSRSPAPKSAKSGLKNPNTLETEIMNQAFESKLEISLPDIQSEGEVSESSKAADQSADKMSGVDIVIGLEDESGEQKPVEIDEADEHFQQNQEPEEVDKSPRPKRKVSITDRVLKNRNCEQQMQHIEETAKNRKQELAELLNEHAQIVQEVSVLARSSSQTSLTGKENEARNENIKFESGKNHKEG